MTEDELLRLEYERDAVEEEFERTHPKCPECGTYMKFQSERYDLYTPYEDKWYECPCCGYCQEY